MKRIVVRSAPWLSTAALAVVSACHGGSPRSSSLFETPEADGGSPTSSETVSLRLNAPPPVSGGTLLVLRDGQTTVASDPDRDKIFVVDLQKAQLLATVPLQEHDEPGRLVEDASGRVHVVLRRGGALVTVVPGTWEISSRRPVCPAPRGVASHNL